MVAYVLELFLIIMGLSIVFAGTYGKSNADNTKDPDKSEEVDPIYSRENMQKTIEFPHQVQTIYTRTIVRPVSYSYVSANVQPTSREMLFKSQSTDENQSNINSDGQLKVEEPIRQENRIELDQLLTNVLVKRPVLNGNEQELQREEINTGLRNEEANLERPYIDEHNSKPVTESPLPKSSQYYRNITNFQHPNRVINRNALHLHQRNLFQRNQGISRPILMKNRRVIYQPKYPLDPIPETILQPPPMPLSLRPIVVPPITNQFGEYRNQNNQVIQKPEVSNDIDEKSTEHLIKRKSAPWRNNKKESDDQKPRLRQQPHSSSPISNTEPLEIKEEEEENEEEAEGDDENYKREDLKISETGKKTHKQVKKESASGSEYVEHKEGKKTEKGEKGYKKDHKHEKAEKRHHHKEAHKGKYGEENGEEKKHHKGEGFYGEHHSGEKGKKDKKYGEEKKHKKGHSTHGVHNIIKKDEYIKKTKFYDEDHGGGEEEEQGEFHGESDAKKGGKKDGSHAEKGYHKKGSAKKGHHDKGHHDEEHAGYEHDDGSDTFSGYEEEYEDKKGKKAAKKWEKH